MCGIAGISSGLMTAWRMAGPGVAMNSPSSMGETAVADVKDDLPVAVEELDTVGGADRGVVERLGDLLRPTR